MKKTIKPFIILSLALASYNSVITLENERVQLPDATRLHEIQVLGTHNSYKKPMDPAVIALIEPIASRALEYYLSAMSDSQKAFYNEYHPNPIGFSESISYSHRDFTYQLDAGIRSLEIDLYHDPEGGRFSTPAAYEILKAKGVNTLLPIDSVNLNQKGFKVLHIPDMDFRSHYATFEMALEELSVWSDNNPSHTPIFIMIEAKDSGFPILPNATAVLPFDSDTFDLLDQTVVDIIGKDKLITPDSVRGGYDTLEEAVLAHQWPKLSEALGKFVFLLLPSAAGMGESNAYLKDHPSLSGRVMFSKSEPGNPEAAFLLLDNAIVRQEAIQSAVKSGYLVRTRADIDNYEAKVNEYTRAKASFESGAQIVSTDYFETGNVFQTEYKVTLPGGQPVRLNPLYKDD